MPLIALGVLTIIFLLFKMVPGDEATLMAGATASQADIELLRARLGLDRPLPEQYASRLAGLVRGDFGYSSTFRGNPLPHVLARLPATLLLMATAITLTVLLGLPAGVLGAVRQNRWPDYLLSLVVVLMLIVALSVDRGWLPSFGFTGWASLVMPTLALAARLVALVARMTRGVMLEELAKDYVRTAHAKGLAAGAVVARHVLRNALIPTVTVIGLQMGYLLGGSVVVERLFAWPGVGDLMVNAVGARDYTLVQAITLLFVSGFLLINLAVDVLYMLINPRLHRA